VKNKHINRFMFGILTIAMVAVVVLVGFGFYCAGDWFLHNPKDLVILGALVGCYLLGWAVMHTAEIK
jgi:hypothetical protein